MQLAPLCVPVEITRHPGGAAQREPAARYFRLALGLCEEAIRLRSAVPDELREGPLQLRLQLPEAAEADASGSAASDAPPDAGGVLTLTAVAEEVVVDAGEDSEHAEHRSLRLRGVTESARARIKSYVTRRLL